MGRGPGPQLRSRLGSFHAHDQHLDELLQQHPLNHVVDVIVPFTTVDEATAVQPQGVPFCFVASLSLPQLLDLDFADLHLRQEDGRRTYAVSTHTPMDTCDAVAVTPDGSLHLSLRASTHEQLGIQGTACAAPRSGYDNATERRYGCVVKLTSKRFRPGVPCYDRIQQCVRDFAPCAVKMLVSVTDAQGCSCDIALPPSAGCQRLVMQPQTWTVTQMSLPPLDAVLGGEGDAATAAAASPSVVHFVADWLGAVINGVIGHATRGAGLGQPQPRGGGSAVQLPRAFDWDAVVGHAEGPKAHSAAWLQRHRWAGLLTPSHVCRAVACARDAVQLRGAPWAAVVVTGFTNSPVAWQHGSGSERPRRAGDDVYMVIVLPKERWWLLDMSAGHE